MTDAITSGVPRRLLQRFLVHDGWTLQQTDRVTRYYLPDEEAESIELIFGNDVSPSMQEKEVRLALETLSALRDATVSKISRDINSLPYDLIAGRIPDEYVRDDSVEFRVAAQYIEGMKVFMASSASTEISGERHFRRTRKEALAYAESCRFGHTFRGSFGFLIESPVGLNDEPTLATVEEMPPMSRRIMERIARGFHSCVEAAAQQDPARITNREAGFSSNMCDALADIVEHTNVSTLDLTLRFSPEWKLSGDCEGKVELCVRSTDVDLLRDAAKSLRTEEKSRRETIIGRVTRLSTEGNPADLLDDPAAREIEVTWLNEENLVLHVKVVLSPKDYLDAVEAHRNGQLVLATGQLGKPGRSWKLENVEAFVTL